METFDIIFLLKRVNISKDRKEIMLKIKTISFYNVIDVF